MSQQTPRTTSLASSVQHDLDMFRTDENRILRRLVSHAESLELECVRLEREKVELVKILSDVMYQISVLAGYEFSKDMPLHESQDIWDDVMVAGYTAIQEK